MYKISDQAKLFFKKFMWNMIYLFSYKSLAMLDEDILYNEFLNEIYKSKKNDLILKGISNSHINNKDEKDVYVIFLYIFFAYFIICCSIFYFIRSYLNIIKIHIIVDLLLEIYH